MHRQTVAIGGIAQGLHALFVAFAGADHDAETRMHQPMARIQAQAKNKKGNKIKRAWIGQYDTAAIAAAGKTEAVVPAVLATADAPKDKHRGKGQRTHDERK